VSTPCRLRPHLGRVVRPWLAAALLLVGSVLATAPAAASNGGWLPPVDAPVIDPFRPPAQRWHAGNRGLAYGTTHGQPVVAVADGTVTFVGTVGRHRHLVIDHGGGLRSTAAFVAEALVVRGQRVGRGQLVARASTGFHLTARLGDQYIDPALLIAGGRPVPRLEPLDAPLPGHAWGRLGAGLLRLSPPSALLDRLTVPDPFRALAWHGIELLPAFRGIVLARSATSWLRNGDECIPDDQPVPPPAAGRVLVQVGGLGTSNEASSIAGLAPDLVGYDARDVVGFSYAGGCTPVPFGFADTPPGSLVERLERRPYAASDTHQDLEVSAGRLADLIDRIAIERPGAPIDVAAHSLGGVVSRRALELLEERHDGSPPVAVVLTVGSPHQAVRGRPGPVARGPGPVGAAAGTRHLELPAGAPTPAVVGAGGGHRRCGRPRRTGEQRPVGRGRERRGRRPGRSEGPRGVAGPSRGPS
jgi:hypothetical protein